MTDHQPDSPANGPEPFDVGGFLAEQGVDLEALPDGDGYRPRGFDPVAFRRDQAHAALAAKIPAKFADARVTDQRVAAWLRGYLADPAHGRSLFLVGPTGVGKTHHLWGCTRAAVEHHAQQGRGLRWEVVTHPDLNAAMRPSDNRDAGLLDRCMRADLLGLDDIGAGKGSEWTEDVLFRLVDYRWSHGLTSIYSSNLIDQALERAVSARVASRMADSVKVALGGGDRRWGRP